MKSKIVKIIDQIGIHARPASKVTNEANKYKSDIKFSVGGKTADAKSLINLMALGVKFNDKIEIQAIGIDEDEAIDGVCDIMKKTNLI